MKGLLIAICFFACIFTASAKKITGRVMDSAGVAITYVNIGFRDASCGTLSDRNGYFALEVPDSLVKYKLSFSHISYKPKDVALSDDMQVELEVSAYRIADVVVRPGKTRNKSLVQRGIRMPLTYATPATAGKEIGTVLTVDRDFVVKQIEFDVFRNTLDSALLRFNVYRMQDEDSFVNIIRSPIYYHIAREKEPVVFGVNPAEQIFLIPGRYFISIEFVELNGEGQILFPCFMHSSYIRETSMGKMKKSPINIGLSVRGVEYH